MLGGKFLLIEFQTEGRVEEARVLVRKSVDDGKVYPCLDYFPMHTRLGKAPIFYFTLTGLVVVITCCV